MVYELPDECAIELANRTVHDICHLGWVPTDDGEYGLRMAALVKTNGRFGRIYMAAIKPIRHLVVYPALTRKWERAWLDRDEHGASGDRSRQRRMIRWAGGLTVLYGAAHTLGALTVEGAAHHAGAWFGRWLWGQSLADMSPAMSAYWLSVNSFGPPLVLLGLTVLWLNRRGITPPPFIAWAMGGWIVLGTVVTGPGMWQDLILLVASGLLLAGARRTDPGDPLAADDPQGAESATKASSVRAG